jgi:hypothetical protein
MSFAKSTSLKRIGPGLVMLLIALPQVYAERPEAARGGGGEPVHMSAPPRPAVVNRVDHGSVRHVDTHVIPQRAVPPPPPSVGHGFVRPLPPVGGRGVGDRPRQFWHGFVFGSRIHGLRPGYFQLTVNGLPYFCDDGIYYQQVGDDYQEVYPPVGADIQDLPDGAIEVDAENSVYYYAGGAFYVQQDGGYVIVPAPIGVIVPELPPGAVQTSVGGWLAYQFNGTYYQPQFVDGVTQYVTISP